MKLLVALLLLASPISLFSQVKRPAYVEAIPDQVQARLEVRSRAAANAARNGSGIEAQYFMFFAKRWPQTKAIKVAFIGGTDDLYAKIASAASDWGKYGDIKFDFMDTGTKQYHQWSRADTTFSADIRVAFDGVDGPGYWSLIGVDSSDPTLIAPNQASLELQGFTSGLPPDWAGTVRHEFGHAIGLMHEHQMPVGGCDQDFKWQDDPGYVPTQDTYGQYINDSQGHHPGIYTLLAGSPNFWPQPKVDANMRQLNTDSHNYDYGPFDPLSIMKYYFDPSFFVSGTASHCYSDENIAISPGDQSGIRKWYPATDSNDFRHLQNEQNAFLQLLKKVQNLQNVQVSK